MAKQTGPIQEVSRALDLVPYLSTHSHVSLKSLANEFGVSEKEMAAELTTLSMCGLPGYTPYELIEVFFDSGFVSINNHEALDIPRALTKLEVASLLIGLELIKDGATEADEKVVTDIDALITQLRELIDGTIEVSSDPHISFRAVIEGAIAKRSVLKLEYISSARDEITEREVSPLSLYTEGAYTYLSAYCHLAQGYRNFRLDRVSEISDTGRAAAQLSESVSADGSATRATLRILGDRRAVTELLQIEAGQTDGVATLDIYSPEWLIRAVLAASPQVEIVEPASLASELSASAAKILALYRS